MNKRQRDDVHDLLELESGLSKWEIEFLENLWDKYHGDATVLSPRQAEVLKRIMDKRL